MIPFLFHLLLMVSITPIVYKFTSCPCLFHQHNKSHVIPSPSLCNLKYSFHSPIFPITFDIFHYSSSHGPCHLHSFSIDGTYSNADVAESILCLNKHLCPIRMSENAEN